MKGVEDMEERTICLHCDGDGYIITHTGNTRECNRCEGTGYIEE